MRYLTEIILSLAVIAATADVQAKSLGEAKKSGHSPDVHCLAQNIYHEARGEPMVGKVAVAHVVLNRAADRRWPARICSVIKQGGATRSVIAASCSGGVTGGATSRRIALPGRKASMWRK